MRDRGGFGRAGRLDRRGAALPLALFGLVAVSLLVTAALVTSSTEVMLSNAHQTGTRSLYSADEALESFVAERALMQADPHLRFTTGAYEPGGGYELRVAELARGEVIEHDDGSVERRDVYSLVAQALSGRGRAVGALIEAVRMAAPAVLNVDSGLTLGTNTTIGGAATISDGSSDGAACDLPAAEHAIRHAADATMTTQGEGHEIIGSIEQDERGAAELMEYVLDGATLEELAARANLKFGAMYAKPAFSNANGPKQNANQVEYRWGCPSKLVAGCDSQQAAFFPVVAIDAQGGEVDITGDHAQGILIIRNGSVRIRGNFRFQGIILAEGSLRVSGTPLIEGAVVAMGSEAIIEPDDSGMTGSSLIRFNRCEIESAQRGLTIQSLDFEEQMVEEPTFAWFEVLR